VTLVAGNTLTIGGGQVVTVGNTPTVTIPAPQIGTRSIATLSFTGGISTDVLGFSFAANKAGSTGGSGGGKVAIHDIQITKQTDKSTPKLFLACANGQHFKTATLVVRKAGGKQVTKQITYTLSDVLIATAQSTGHGQKLVDSLTLNYAKLTIQTGKAHA
jgi:type VI secretion system Hcp family effector